MSRVAVLVDSGFEDEELRAPVEALRAAGHYVDLVGLVAGRRYKGRNGIMAVRSDRAVESCRPDQYDALLIPGGYAPEHLREHDEVVDLVRSMDVAESGIFAISRGPQLLLSAGRVRNRHLTAFKTVLGDLRQAGARTVDREVVVDGNLVTSRQVEDLPAFIQACIGQLARYPSLAYSPA